MVYLEDHDFYIRSSWDGQCQDKIAPIRGYKQNIQQLQTPQISTLPKAQTIPNLPKVGVFCLEKINVIAFPVREF